MVAALLQRDGFNVLQRHGGAGDRGADALAVAPTGEKLVGQCRLITAAQHSPAWAVPSSTTVTATPQSAEVGTQVELAATVDCPADATGGLGVTFFDGNTLLDTVPVNANGQASHTTTFTTVGSHTITAAYNSTRSATPPAAPRPSRSHPLRRRPDRPPASVSSPAAD
ncbi:Ig-like domain repeat protein [Streptomyces anulatus]